MNQAVTATFTSINNNCNVNPTDSISSPSNNSPLGEGEDLHSKDNTVVVEEDQEEYKIF